MRHFLLVLALTLICAGLPPARSASAASCAWTGAVSTAWENAGNWSCSAVPGPGDAVTINSVGATVVVSSAASAASLTINRGTISGAGTLDVSGLTRIQAFQDVTISTSGSRLPQLEIAADSGIVRLSDPALSGDSLQTLVINTTPGGSGSSVLQVGDHSVGALTLTRGNLSWGGTLSVTGSFSWVAGGLSAASGSSATLLIAAGASGTIPTAVGAGQTLGGATLTNNGTLTLTGTPALSLSSGITRAKLINNGTLEFLTAGPMVLMGSGDVRNNGTLRAGGTLQFDLGVPLVNAGLLDVGAGRLHAVELELQAGELRLAGGSVRSGNNQFAQIRLAGGSITGSGTITGTIQNIGGTLAPSGPLRVFGGYTQGPTATLDLALGGLASGSNFGVLQLTPNQGIGGGATINGGRLKINATGGFSPAAGDRFQVAQCSTSCQGSFGTVSGGLTPAFSGFAGGQEIVVAEARSAVLVGMKPSRPTLLRSETNAYTLSIVNPTGTALSVSSIVVTLPISFTYQLGSTSGALTSNPSDLPFPAGGTRQLVWGGPITLPAQASVELRFTVVPTPQIEIGRYSVDLQLQAGGNSVTYRGLAPVTIPLAAASAITVSGGGRLQTSTDPPTMLIPRGQLSQGVTITARITCPFVSCGNLTAVYLEHGGRLITMTPVAAPAGAEPSLQANDYGFWRGYISGPSVFPGEPSRIFPDWDDHRPCIYYDYGGGGGRPMGCVSGGDNGPVPQLYDPSGSVTDASTGQPVIGASVTLFRQRGAAPDTRAQTRDCRTVDTRQGGVWGGVAPGTGVAELPGLLPAQIDPPVNPQVTGGDGRYGWNVVSGCWYVQVSAPGYATKISALVGVPPEVTDLNIVLEPAAPAADPYKVHLPLVQR